MTIATEKDVGVAVAYMAEFPHPLALARKDLTDATNKYAEVYSRVYLEQDGTIKDREAKTELDKRVIDAKKAITEAQLELDSHKSRVEWANMIIEIWRSEGANKRASERFR